MTVSHYDRLGVPSDATLEQIRLAYRELAWKHHPDRTGRATSSEMMEINEAWRVLSDPMLRHTYDAGLDSSGRTTRPSTPSASSRSHDWLGTVGAAPARFPWRFVLGFFVMAVAIILFMGVITDSAKPVPIDNVIAVGSCVDVDTVRREAWEVNCEGPHAAQVVQMVPFDAVCPNTLTAYRDRQGMGQVCVLDS